eukprot:14034297-Alexandrium_andersonii.AAC.1
MGDLNRGFFVWVNQGDRFNIGTDGNASCSGKVTARGISTDYVKLNASVISNPTAGAIVFNNNELKFFDGADWFLNNMTAVLPNPAMYLDSSSYSSGST